ncbi:lipopolysaccharide biosynthesis protein [Clostridium perfringens]|uniref:lipopolysaccharide biosynthesis protein n=1 Tax=Clostridium perfringens TaxID=1502 RepID=UPI00244514CA|nr:lipopolysaccharide biosynthesis protein [Clostridium perfringens]MDG6885047.1 Teichuronic acid biosynthesis protein TuaB [Clostridium perfringens]
MKNENLQTKVINATKWSAITEIATKIMSPITNMILARIISPEEFGVVATVTMVFSFADMLTEGGFQKYLIQKEFSNKNEKYKNANVAFWSNLTVSMILWIIIIIFRNEIATLVGTPKLGYVLAIACIQLPITSFSSVQMALYRREFEFHTLFKVRIILAIIPIIITIPLGVLGFSYWAFIIAGIASQLINSILLTMMSKWRPKMFFSIAILRDMIKFSTWSLIEALALWVATWVDAFIISSYLSQYELGIYKTGTTMVNTLMTIVVGAITPVLFSALSRLQEDTIEFKNMYLNTQRNVALIILPMGVGIFLYSDLATQIMLGSNWGAASEVIGVWALSSSIMIIFSQFCSEVYRAKGKPKLAFIAQTLYIIILIPICIISANMGFKPLLYMRSWIKLEFVLVNLIIMRILTGISFKIVVKRLLPIIISTSVMYIFGKTLKVIGCGIIWDIISIIICIIIYGGSLLTFSDLRDEFIGIIKKVKNRREFN